MNDRIEVLGVRALGRHGANPGERDHPQPFDVDVIALAAVVTTDRIEDALDYRQIVAVIRRTVADESFALVESIARAIGERVLALGAAAARVRVSKPGAASGLGAREVAVTIEVPASPDGPRGT